MPVTINASHKSQFYSVTEWIISTLDEIATTFMNLPPTQTAASTATVSAELPPQPSNAHATTPATASTNSHNSVYYSVTECIISTVDENTVGIPPCTGHTHHHHGRFCHRDTRHANTVTEWVVSTKPAAPAEPATVPVPAGSIVVTTTEATASTTATIVATDPGVMPTKRCFLDSDTPLHLLFPPTPGNGAAYLTPVTPTSPSSTSFEEYLSDTKSIASPKKLSCDTPGQLK
ncbi:hypothetical protein BC830DRAFT_1084949 [Chytriomyces sp. MP71]|nr:hypothetical protein BC830DRAFT_1084949 [Chytriomyces sp. MP71]